METGVQEIRDLDSFSDWTEEQFDRAFPPEPPIVRRVGADLERPAACMATQDALYGVIVSLDEPVQRLLGTMPTCPYHLRGEHDWQEWEHDELGRRGNEVDDSGDHRACLAWLSEVERFAETIGPKRTVLRLMLDRLQALAEGYGADHPNSQLWSNQTVELLDHRSTLPADRRAVSAAMSDPGARIIVLRPSATQQDWLAFWKDLKLPRTNGKKDKASRPHRRLLWWRWRRDGVSLAGIAERWHARTMDGPHPSGAADRKAVAAEDRPWASNLPPIEVMAYREWQSCGGKTENHEDAYIHREIQKVKRHLADLMIVDTPAYCFISNGHGRLSTEPLGLDDPSSLGQLAGLIMEAPPPGLAQFTGDHLSRLIDDALARHAEPPDPEGDSTR